MFTQIYLNNKIEVSIPITILTKSYNKKNVHLYNNNYLILKYMLTLTKILSTTAIVRIVSTTSSHQSLTC